MKFSDVLFAPSDWAEQNLRKLKVKGRVINVGQNTNVDAVHYALERGQRNMDMPTPYCVITVHRIETIMSRDRLRFILDVIERISSTVTVVFVRHDPTERKLAEYGLQPKLDGISRVIQHKLLPHAEFIQLIAHANFVITDGGSIQEECYYLDRPCLVMRSETERLEGLGGNVVLGNFDWKTVQGFLDEYESKIRGHPIDSQSPSKLIAEHLGKLTART